MTGVIIFCFKVMGDWTSVQFRLKIEQKPLTKGTKVNYCYINGDFVSSGCAHYCDDVEKRILAADDETILALQAIWMMIHRLKSKERV